MRTFACMHTSYPSVGTMSASARGRRDRARCCFAVQVGMYCCRFAAWLPLRGIAPLDQDCSTLCHRSSGKEPSATSLRHADGNIAGSLLRTGTAAVTIDTWSCFEHIDTHAGVVLSGVVSVGERVAVQEGDSPVSLEGVFVAESRGYVARPSDQAAAAAAQHSARQHSSSSCPTIGTGERKQWGRFPSASANS